MLTAPVSGFVPMTPALRSVTVITALTVPPSHSPRSGIVSETPSRVG